MKVSTFSLGGISEALAHYRKRAVLLVLALGFASGLPLLLVTSTLTAWLTVYGISRTTAGLVALVQLPYALKFLWASLPDRLPSPLRLGRRRGWGIAIQIALIVAIAIMATLHPERQFLLVAAIALLIAFLSASQDIVIDAFRIESLMDEEQGAGAGAALVGYRLGMLMGGGGTLLVAYAYGWCAAYLLAAAGLSIGVLAFLLAPESNGAFAGPRCAEAGAMRSSALALCTRAFLARPGAAAILLFAMLFKLSDAITLSMSTPFYLSLGFTLREIAERSSFWAFPAVMLGGVVGGGMVARHGLPRAILSCGVLQAAGVASYALLALAGHEPWLLTATSIVEGFTGGMAWAAFVAYLSSLCDLPAFTATQYALLSSVMAFGRTLFAAPSGFLSSLLGWPVFFLVTSAIGLASVGLFLFVSRRWPQFAIAAPARG